MTKKQIFYYLIIGALVLAIFLIFQVFSASRLKVVFFDIGQGDSIFVQTPSQKQILIDGGPNSLVLEKIGRQMGYWDRTLDLVILTHPDQDHLAGLISVLDFYRVKLILTSGFKQDSLLFKKWQKKIKDIEVKKAQAGQLIDFGDGVKLEVLWPNLDCIKKDKKANNCSVVGRLLFNEASLLLTGDIEKKIELKLIEKNIQAQVLKIAHHGSKSSSEESFLEAVQPQITVISVGQNQFGHPHQEILDRLKSKSLILLRTDFLGDIKLIGQKSGFLVDQ